MLNIAHDIYETAITVLLAGLLLTLLLALVPIIWVSAFSTGTRGKRAMKTLKILFRRRPTK